MKHANEKAEGEIVTGIIVVGLIIIGIVAFCLLFVAGFAAHWLGGAADVVQQETDPHVMLQKYKTMLNEQNGLEELNTNIKVYQKQLDDISKNNVGTPRNQWAASDREQYDNIYNAVSASKITFNNLAEKYNAQQKDISYAFCNQAQLPTGATVVLNREYVPYTV
jgi:hypothetical protein